MAEPRTQVPHVPGAGLRYDIGDAETKSTRARPPDDRPRWRAGSRGSISAVLRPSTANATSHAVCARPLRKDFSAGGPKVVSREERDRGGDYTRAVN
jgi:hypothetical protein